MRASKGVARLKSSAADGRKRYADWAGLVGSGLLGGGCGAEKKLAKRVNGDLGNGDFARGVRRGGQLPCLRVRRPSAGATRIRGRGRPARPSTPYCPRLASRGSVNGLV